MTTEAAAGAVDNSLLTATARPSMAAGQRWSMWAGVAISCAMLAAIVLEFRRQGFHLFEGILPRSPWFWTVMIIAYCVTPLSEWVIFRRLWSIPADGLAALMRKRVSNELLLGYLGEVQFYAWARSRAKLTAAPFGAIKDVAILYALAGNGVTMLMLVATLPMLLSVKVAVDHRAFIASVAALVIITAVPLALRRRLFSLPEGERRFVLVVHLVRIAANLLLVAYLWHMLLPHVALHFWLLLATIRQLLSRLPFLPNKDILFAGVAMLFVGTDVQMAAMIALITSITLILHLLVGAVLAALDVACA